MKYLVLSLIIFFMLLPATVKAQELSREIMKLDEALTDDTKNNQFRQPKNIVIVPIEPTVSQFSINTSEWFQGLYYYMAGRLGLGDILFHYGVGQDGLIFTGIKYGDEQSVFLKDGPENPIVIAYLSESGATDFDNSSYNELSDLLIKLANRHAIPLTNVSVKKVNFVKTAEGLSVNAVEPGGRYKFTLNEIKKEIQPKYNPQPRIYKVELKDLELPGEPVNPGDNVVIKFKVKNTGEFTIFKGTDPEFIISTKDNKASKFYIQGEWLTTSQAELMNDGEFLRPGEEVQVDFSLTIPLYFGDQLEKVHLIDLNGKVYAGTEFDLRVKVNRINKPVVEILETETGTLNVRNAAGGSTVVTTVLPGQRFIEMARNAGWVQIDLGNGQNGWVLQKYVKTV